MRKGFEGLFGIVRDRLRIDPLSGHVFVFCNARKNRLKILYWDGSGLWICSKRLEKGRFSWPSQGDQNGKVRLSQEQLSMLLGGIELQETRKEARNIERNGQRGEGGEEEKPMKGSRPRRGRKESSYCWSRKNACAAIVANRRWSSVTRPPSNSMSNRPNILSG